MALKSTIYKATLQVADIDRGWYGEVPATLARHPSETDERMMVRLVALALNAHAVQTECAGDATLGFGRGLSDPDEPDVVLRDFTGRARRWIEVGQPEERPIARAGSQADRVIVYAYGPAAEVWWKGLQNKVARLDKLEVWRLPADAMADLTALAARTMQLSATIQDGALTLAGDAGSVLVEPVRWKEAR